MIDMNEKISRMQFQAVTIYSVQSKAQFNIIYKNQTNFVNRLTIDKMNHNKMPRARPARSQRQFAVALVFSAAAIVSLTATLYLNQFALAQQQQESQAAVDNRTSSQGEKIQTLSLPSNGQQDDQAQNQSSVTLTIKLKPSSSTQNTNLLFNNTRLATENIDHQQQQQQQQQQVADGEIPIINGAGNSNIAALQANYSSTSTSATKSVPILRPSIEEVASELSKKYLNLERHKNPASISQHAVSGVQHQLSSQDAPPQPSTPPQQQQQQQQFDKDDAETGNHAEQDDIILQHPYPQQQLDRANGSTTSGSSLSSSSFKQTSTHKRDNIVSSSQRLVGELASIEAQYLHVDTIAATANAAISARSRHNSRASRTNRYSSKRKASNDPRRLAHLHERSNEDDEFNQCQEYLYKHSAAYQATTTNSEPLSSDLSSYNKYLTYLNSANNLLPCSCETGWHFASESSLTLDYTLNSLKGAESRVWLNCDHIQLIGSQLFTPHYSQQTNFSHGHGTSDQKNTGYQDDYHQTNALLTQFSQRDADLQILFSQKFHYLQLSSLKSIDLSGNRLRIIKMDAFHGLENKLEFLNLANNLLGDARAMFASEFQNSHQSQAAASNGSSAGATPNSGKSIFISDELNKLRDLKWLSLQNNQINQLSSSIFIKQHATGQNNHHITIGADHQDKISVNGQAAAAAAASASAAPTSELLYLDLSYNLFKIVPSDSVQRLNKLQVLKLNNNKITLLDDSSKFPHSLKYLDLSENLIDIVRHSDLIDLPNLIELNLSNNRLRHLDQLAFVSVNSLITQSPIINSLAKGHSQAQAKVDADIGSAGRDTSNLLRSGIVGESSRYIAADDTGSPSSHSRQVRDTKFADTENEHEILEAVETSLSESDQENDLDAEESLFSALTSRFNRNNQATMSEELNVSRVTRQFNSTLKLNLSRNFFENLPGDSLLKFTNLQFLDLSHNRLRHLDSNYLCSIYNLVDNLRYLDLSGNLLSFDQQQGSSNNGQLNKLFGCLQKLEKLLLSTNRLAVTSSGQSQATTNGHEPEIDLSQTTTGQPAANIDSKEAPSFSQNVALTFKFGENFGSKYLNTLDLSDNRLQSFPIIEQVIEQPPMTIQNSSNGDSVISSDQARMNQWMSYRTYLEVLNLNYNFIERIGSHDLEYLYNLRQLHLDFNKLVSLPVELMRRFTSLDILSIAGNRIASLNPFDELLERSVKTLRVLNLANNRLVDWPQLSNRLTSQYANNMNNQLFVSNQDHYRLSNTLANPSTNDQSTKQSTMIEFALEDLNLEGNLLTSTNVTSLFDQMIYMKSLKVLNLNYNLLNKIRSDWFKFANNLQRLLLRGNKINNIDLGAFALNQVNHLIQLDLDYNLLKELKRKTFDSMPRIRELNLAHNLIHTINSETFHQLNSLHVLKLNNNKLTSWKCEYFSYLCNSISGNINVDLATLISSSHGQQVLNQQQLQQSQPQQPTSTSSGAVSSLIELDLSHNSLSQLRANSISVHSKLVRLNLAHNKLSFIPHDLFKATTSILNGDRQVHLISSLKYLNLAHNRIQTIDNINFKPLKNLITLDLSFNELQALGTDVVNRESNREQQESSQRRVIVSNNLTSLLVDNDTPHFLQEANQTRLGRSLYSVSSWPALFKLRHLNLAHNTISMINQSLLSELSPFVALNLNLSFNYLDSDILPAGFFTKISSASLGRTTLQQNNGQQREQDSKQSYDLVFTVKLESLDLSHNRLSEWPGTLLDNHYSSMESCNLSHNRIQNLPQNSNSMIQIRALNFEFNPLSRESSELLLTEQRSLRYLNLAATRLYAIQQATADSAQYLRSVSNLKFRLVNQTSQLDLIRSISKPIEAPYLRHLNLSSNQLVWLSANVFDKMHSLRTLDLSNNQLTRLHLLSNQLAHVSPTLEYLNVGSNLFTSIDLTDFNQLSRLQHLDLSNLLSLQKLDCRFLARLNTLTRLKMFNYPQLRHNINNLVKSFRSNSLSEKHLQKVQNELIMSTIGGHCVQDVTMLTSNGVSNERESLASNLHEYGRNWFKLEHIELELFNNFANLDDSISDSFQLQDELKQFLGPTTKKLTLFGLNLTSISDTSLIGVTNDDLELRISYTSISQLPLRQILTSLAKRTKLKLDLRNNDIQSIDVDALQWLDELQQINLASSHHHINDEPYSSFSLKLASNPFRCDCQTRPLWLWLNQRWDNVEPPQTSDDQIGEVSAGNNANYWLKFHTLSHTNDLKCFYPLKLRGKLAQHVYYNDLVCKGASHPSSAPSITGRQSRKRNETTKSSDLYYSTSLNDSDDSEDLDDDDYADFSSDWQTTKAHAVVRVTRFNRYPSAISNSTSMYFLNNFPFVPFIPDTSEQPGSDAISHLGKRDQNSTPTHSDGNTSEHDIQTESTVNTKYSKHRPNTHQKHSHFNTMTNLNPAQFGKGSNSRVNRGLNQASSSQQNHPSKQSILTESDIMILTVASVAMAIMSLIIISVCLFKYKLDQTDHEHILSTHSKLVMSQALFSSKSNISTGPSNQNSTRTSSSRSSSSKKSSTNSKSSSSRQNKNKSSNQTSKKYHPTNAKSLEISKLNASISKQTQHFRTHNQHLLTPVNLAHHGHSILAAPAAQNFLMRSPTIRRMHGLANNASDWFKYTLRAYPTNNGSRRRRLFIQNSAMSGPSQLNTARLANCYNHQQLLQHPHKQPDKFLYNPLILTGCPVHEFKCLNEISAVENGGDRLKNFDKCLYCGNIMTAMKQTKVEYPFVRQSLATDIKHSSETNKKLATNKSLETEDSCANNDDGLQTDREQAIESNGRVGSNLTFQATIEQNGGFMPPKMIQALAKRLDERHGIVDELKSNSQQENSRDYHKQPQQQQHQHQSTVGNSNVRLSSSFHSRDQQKRSMRTFGYNGEQSTTSVQCPSKADNQPNQSSADKVPSQIPTIDVDGRFTYQTGSQIDSPYGTPQIIEYNSQTNTHGGNTPSSTVATGQEDIFILIRDTPTSEATRDSIDSRGLTGGNHNNRMSGTRVARPIDCHSGTSCEQNVNLIRSEEAGMSMMNDECSRTSSPIAYGFMRSSPSATTLSSNTITTYQNQYTVNNKSPEISSLVSLKHDVRNQVNKLQASQSSDDQRLYRHQQEQSSTRPSFGSTSGKFERKQSVCGFKSFDQDCSDANNNSNNNNYTNQTHPNNYRKDNNSISMHTSSLQQPEQYRWVTKQDVDNKSSAELNNDDQVIISRL